MRGANNSSAEQGEMHSGGIGRGHCLSLLTIKWDEIIHYMTKSMWTFACRTSHAKVMGINMELLPVLLL